MLHWFMGFVFKIATYIEYNFIFNYMDISTFSHYMFMLVQSLCKKQKVNLIALRIKYEKWMGKKISNARWNNVSTLSIRNIRYTLSVYDVLHTRTLYVVGLHAEIDNAIVRRRGDSNGTYWNGMRIERI